MSYGKKIIALIKRDIRMGKRSILIKFMIFFVLFSIYQLLYVYYHGSYEAININTLIFNTFKGCDFIEVATDLTSGKFDLPLAWLFINSYIIYAVGDYFYEDIKVNGKCVLIRSIFPREATRYINKEYLKIDTFILIKNVFIMYTLTSISLVVIFITLTLCLKPTYSFIVDIVICLLSVFSSSNLFLGQHSLLLRHVSFNTYHNLTLNYSIIYNLVLLIIVTTIGYILSSKKDVFYEEEMEEAYIELNNVTKVIKGNIILDNSNLSFEKGKIYGIKGQNGSGKTILFRAICVL